MKKILFTVWLTGFVISLGIASTVPVASGNRAAWVAPTAKVLVSALWPVILIGMQFQ